MKISSFGITQIALGMGSALLLTATNLHAQENPGPSGYYVNGDVGVSFGDNVTANIGFGNDETSLKTGVRTDLSAGYNFALGRNFYLAPELELGYLYPSDDNGSGNSGGFSQVPVLVNGVLEWKFAPKWSVYGGLGVGGEYMYVSNSDGDGGSGGVAWQGKLGVKYQLGPGELGLGYEYLGAAAPFLTIANHTIFASYTLHF